MGFFSSRRPEDEVAQPDKSVVHVIRSRFYCKNRGKEREEASGTFVDPTSSTAQTLSSPSVAQAPGNANVLASPHKKVSGSSLRHTNGASTSKLATNMSSPTSIRPSTRSTKENHAIASPSPKKASDNATMTLAQRLNELAVANADGLLNEDEYRMLRQNLFERFASSSTVPSEAPVVPVTPRLHTQGAESSHMSHASRPSSNFVVEPRSPSIRSKSSVSSLFRRGSSRRAEGGSKDFNDSASMFSNNSTTSNIFRGLRKKSSSSSLASARTEASRPVADTSSIVSRRTGYSVSDRNEINTTPHVPSLTRSAASSIRRYATPPSSFPGRVLPANEVKYTGHVQDVFDEENLKSSVDIKEEMATVEAERKRLTDAFNGLELSTLTKQRQGKVQRVHDDAESARWTLIPDSRSLRRADSDATSVRSGTSMSTTYTGRRAVVRQKTSSSLTGSIPRKNSVSSMSSGMGYGGGLAPPVPPIPVGLSLAHNGSSSSLNLARSTGHLPMTSVPEEISSQRTISVLSVVDSELEREMEEIRKRREEVGMRYDARLEYLRAKLKGALLHEKLMKK